MCPQCRGIGCGAQCEEHFAEAHATALLANHTPISLKSAKDAGGSGLCDDHGKEFLFAVESKAEDGSAQFKMYCPKCLTKDGAVQFAGMDLGSLAEELRKTLPSLLESEFEDKFKSGIKLSLALEARFKELVGNKACKGSISKRKETEGSISEAKRGIRAFFEELHAILRENCTKLEDQVDAEAKNRIAVLQRLHTQCVEFVSRVQHAMAVGNAVLSDEGTSAASVVRCHNRLASANQAVLPSMEQAPPSTFVVDLPEDTRAMLQNRCVGTVLPPLEAPLDLSVSVSETGIAEVKWAAAFPFGNEEFEVAFDTPEEATSGSGVTVYRGKDRSFKVDLSDHIPLVEENGEYALQVRSTVGSNPDCLTGKSGWSEPVNFRVPAGALSHPVMVVPGGHNGGLVPTVEGFDMVTRKWIEMAPMSAPCYGTCCAVLDNTMYAISGYITGYLKRAEMVQGGASSLIWKESVACMTPHYVGGIVARQDGRIWVLGGHNGQATCSTVEHWRPGEERWSVGPPMTVCCGQHMSAVELPSGELMVFGGTSSQTKAERLSGTGSDCRWSELPVTSAVGTLWGCNSCVLNGRVIVAGPAKKVFGLDIRERRSWDKLPDMSEAKEHHPGCLVWNNEFYIAGSATSGSHMEIYDPAANAWRQEEGMRKTRSITSAGLLRMRF